MNDFTRFFKKNSSTILTVLGAGGVIATTVMAVKATPKALEVLKQAEEEKGEKLTVLEKVKVAGPAYIPSAVVGASTIACIFGANALNQRQQASIAGAYALLDQSYKEFKKKVDELHGEDASTQIKTEIAKDKIVTHHKADHDEVHEDDECLFIDMSRMMYFSSTHDKVLRGFDCFNEMLAMRGYASVNDLYELIGAEPLDEGCEYGWSEKMFDLRMEQREPEVIFTLEKQILDDGMEIWTIEPDIDPSPEFLFW